MKTRFTSTLVALTLLDALPGCQTAATRQMSQHNAEVKATTASFGA